MEEGARVRDPLGDVPQLFVELTPKRGFEPLVAVDVASRQRDRARSQPPRHLSLLGEHVAVPDEHEHDAVERRRAAAPGSERTARGRHWAPPARSARATAVPRPRRVASTIAPVMMSMVTIASAATG